MTWNHWNVLAKATANYAQANLTHLHRGKIQIKIVADGVAVLAHFVNHLDAKAKRIPSEVAMLREKIEQAGRQAIGIGQSDDGQTWCVLVKIIGETGNTEEAVPCTTST